MYTKVAPIMLRALLYWGYFRYYDGDWEQKNISVEDTLWFKLAAVTNMPV